MCDYSLHAVASRPAKVGETLITTTFPRTSTRGFAAESEPGMAVCLLPGTELAFEQNVKYDQGWIWTRTTSFRVAKFGVVEPNVPHRHHDARMHGADQHVGLVALHELIRVVGGLRRFGLVVDSEELD